MELLRHETDNIKLDGKLWQELGGLKRDAVGYKSSANAKLGAATKLGLFSNGLLQWCQGYRLTMKKTSC